MVVELVLLMAAQLLAVAAAPAATGGRGGAGGEGRGAMALTVAEVQC